MSHVIGRSGVRLASTSLALVAAMAACGASPASPVSPDAQPRLQIVDAAGVLAPYDAEIRRIAAATIDRVTQGFPLDSVTVTVMPDASRSIGGYGVGGFTPDRRTVRMYLDPGFPTLAAVVADRFGPLLAHELHHARRWAGPGYGRTLFEAMISEGLADRFSIEHLGAALPPWSDAFGRERTEELLALARPEFDSPTYDHQRWFFGPIAPLPRWTGYTLGYRLVESYQARNPGQTAAQLVHAPAAGFLPR